MIAAILPWVVSAVGAFLPELINAFMHKSPEEAAATVKPQYDSIVQRLMGSGMGRAEAEMVADQSIKPELEKAQEGGGLGALGPLLSIAGGVGGFSIGKKLATLAGKAALKAAAPAAAAAVAAPAAESVAAKAATELPDIGNVMKPGMTSKVPLPEQTLTQARPSQAPGRQFEGDVSPRMEPSMYPEVSAAPELAESAIIPEYLPPEPMGLLPAPRMSGRVNPPGFRKMSELDTITGSSPPPAAYMTRENIGMPMDEAASASRGFSMLPESRNIGYDQGAYVDRLNQLDQLRRQFAYLTNQGG